MSLREKRKRDTRKSIMNSSRHLFFKSGYKATSMGKIAEHSCVAVGTLYNYFKSKGEIMLVIVNDDAADLLAPPGSAEKDSLSVEDIIWQFTDKLIGFISAYPRELIKELIGVFWEAGQENLSDGLASIDIRIMNQITQLVSHLRKEGRIKEETDPGTVALALYGMAITAVMWYSVDPGITLEKTRDTIAAMTGHFCRGILSAGGG